jgi:hypothetical protein
VRNVPWLILAILVLFAGKAWGDWSDRSPTRDVVQTVVRTVAPQEYRDILEHYELREGGLRGFIEGIESRPPRIITKTDTLVLPAVAQGRARVDRSGQLTLEVLRLAPDTAAYVPELHEDIDVSDCDEGFAINAGEVLCDRARLGHLYVVPASTLHYASATLLWKRSYRSGWWFRAGPHFPYDGTPWRVDIEVARALRIF